MESILDENETETSAKSDNQNTATDGNESSKKIEEINIEKKVSFKFIIVSDYIYNFLSVSIYNIVILRKMHLFLYCINDFYII